MKLHPGVREGQAFVVLDFGGCTKHPDDRKLAMTTLHDRLIELYPIRLGPVEWRFYDPDAAASMLAEAGLADHPNAAGLVAFLATTPDAELIVASVAVPWPDA